MKLRESLQQPLGLCPFSNARCSYENHAGCAPESHVTMRMANLTGELYVLGGEVRKLALSSKLQEQERWRQVLRSGAVRCSAAAVRTEGRSTTNWLRRCGIRNSVMVCEPRDFTRATSAGNKMSRCDPRRDRASGSGTQLAVQEVPMMNGLAAGSDVKCEGERKRAEGGRKLESLAAPRCTDYESEASGSVACVRWPA